MYNSNGNNIENELILIVDDQVENLKILGNILGERNYRIALATNGTEALNFVERKLPNLILLDVMMPDIDGFEVCSRLKAYEKTKDIPIIFLTAKSQMEDMLYGFKIGGVDYITKPFKQEELMARVETHLQLKHSRDIILKQNENLLKLNNEKGMFLSLAAHDLKNPALVITGFAGIMEKSAEELTPEDTREFAVDIRESGNTMLGILSDLVEINQFEQGKVQFMFENVHISNLLERIVDDMKSYANKKSIEINYESQINSDTIDSDMEKVEKIFSNLISNAIKFSPFGKKVMVKASDFIDKFDDQKFVRIEVQDEGPGLNEDDKKKLFQKFAKLSAKPTNNESSTRLGLSIVKNIVDNLKGRIRCDSEPGKGTNFIVELPVTNHK